MGLLKGKRWTTIRITVETRERLRKLVQKKGETWDEILQRLISKCTQ